MELHHRELAETEAKQLQEKLRSLEEQVQIYSTTAKVPINYTNYTFRPRVV
jgi:hypothetical protein